MINYILKYRTGNLIIIYCCTYSGLSVTMGNVIQNSMELIRSARSVFWVNK